MKDKYKELLVARYYVEHVKSVETAAEEICDEESVGTWTKLTTIENTEIDIIPRLRAEILDTKVHGDHEGYQSGEVLIGFKTETFDAEAGITSILSMLAGNLFGLGALRNIRWMDVEFPRSIAENFPGPKFGVEGVRKILGTDKGEFPNRPHVGTIVKPKMGLTAKEWAQVAYEAAIGGVDFIKDDENLSNQPFCPISDRTVAVLEKMDQVKEETGRTVIHAVNVTAKHDVMWRRIEEAIDNGAKCLMIDVILTGFQELAQMAADPSVKVPIHVHRTMHAAFTRNQKHGISMLPVSKIVRMVGGDQLHIGSYGQGKMDTELDLELQIKDSMLNPMYEFKQTFPVASGGLYPAKIPNLVKHGGNNLIIQAGGGIHGHPDGTRKGAMAMRQALDATLKNIPLKEYAKEHVELARALEKWGN
ncbi:MAG: RuBisCO large subunit C-terminal-like domain-containing protein [Candidatus Heimdallarchaeaceae archaeon]|jgi:ribulose-bisphosphate carboxylase large chain